MIEGHPEICLFQPDIPQNTGNIGRLAAGTQCRLHVVTPVGFSMDDKNLRRSGLDYWPYLDLEIHDNIEVLLARFKPEEIAFLSTRGKKSYTEISSKIKLIVFGRETKGLTEELYNNFAASLYKIPIYHNKVRSLNLANSVAIVTYHRLSLTS